MGRKRLPSTTNFVVTGLARSGTTYMMRCLEAGGIEPIKQSWRYEIRNQDARPIKPELWEGKCFKHFTYRLWKYDASNMAIIFMRRKPYDILVSCIRFHSRIHPWLANMKMWKNKRGDNKGWEVDISPYEEMRLRCAKRWRKEARSYVECTLENMNSYPKRLRFFEDLVKEGWPIDPKKAALIENDERERIKKRGRPVAWT